MTYKKWLLLGTAAVLAAVSLYMNSDWFRSDDIQIVHRIAPERMVRNRKPPKPGEVRVVPVLFSFDRKLELTEVKVVKVSEFETNKFAHPVWHLVSDSNAVPTKGIVYGAKVQGMRPKIDGATADPCEPGAKYRLLLKAGAREASHDFVLTVSQQ